VKIAVAQWTAFVLSALIDVQGRRKQQVSEADDNHIDRRIGRRCGMQHRPRRRCGREFGCQRGR
jgi:hypothetical protein